MSKIDDIFHKAVGHGSPRFQELVKTFPDRRKAMKNDVVNVVSDVLSYKERRKWNKVRAQADRDYAVLKRAKATFAGIKIATPEDEIDAQEVRQRRGFVQPKIGGAKAGVETLKIYKGK